MIILHLFFLALVALLIIDGAVRASISKKDFGQRLK